MTGIHASLGPLERVDGRWGVGDAVRPGRTWVEFREDGLYRHAGAGEGELTPWPRIMLGVRVTIGRGYPTHGGDFTLTGFLAGVPGLRGRGTGHLDMTLRHPYEERRLDFHRHARWYRLVEVAILAELLGQTVAAKEGRRLADTDWLDRVVGSLAPTSTWSAGGIQQAVRTAREA
ncbi:hypothetical protein ACWGII_22230 [Streptomyces sp. NPDC054855]